MSATTPASLATAVVVLADDLVWASRLRAAIEKAGGRAITAGSLKLMLERADPAVAGAIVDLNGRAYDGVEAVRAAAGAGLAVVAVGQHDDLATRKAALGAGARRVFSYNKMFSDGPSVVSALVEGRL